MYTPFDTIKLPANLNLSVLVQQATSLLSFQLSANASTLLQTNMTRSWVR